MMKEEDSCVFFYRVGIYQKDLDLFLTLLNLCFSQW